MEAKFVASVLEDWHLSLSPEVSEKLQLKVGDKVELVIKPLAQIPDEENPLFKLKGSATVALRMGQRNTIATYT